jgi:ATP-binding cassette subfamily B protein
MRDFDLAHMRRSIGVVLQESFLFEGTIRENIAITKPSATFEEIVFAARMAGADEFIQNLPNGYDTPLYEGGSNLSGGQRQRVSIARTLLTQPSILILDEATSALDAESEAIIQANLTAIAHGRTMLIVSHRLSMLTMCHSIIVMEKGQIIGNAPHDELLRTCPLYADLWYKQNRHIMAELQGRA